MKRLGNTIFNRLLLVHRGLAGCLVVGCAVDFFGEPVPVTLSNAYPPGGWLPLWPTARPSC